MTHCLGSRGPGQDGCVSPGPFVNPSKRPHKPEGRGSVDRNHCITDFFKPDVTQEKDNGKARLPCADHLKKTFSSPKKNRRKKIPFSPSQRSPIIDAFFKTAKLEKKDSPCHGVHNTMKTMHSKDVVRKLFISNGSSGCSFILNDSACTKHLERNEIHPVRARTPLTENGKECKMDYVDLGSSDSNLSKSASTSENKSLKRDFSGLRSPLQEKKTKDTADILRKRQCSASWESSSDESSPMQASQGPFSSEQASNRSINTKKSFPSVNSNSMILRKSKHKECPEKTGGKHVKSDIKTSQKSTVGRLDNHNSTSLLHKHISAYSKDSMSPSGRIQVEDRGISEHDMFLPAECLNTEEANNSYSGALARNCLNETASTKESQLLEKSQDQVNINASGSEHIISPKPQPSKKPKTSKLHIKNNKLIETLEIILQKQYPRLLISNNLQPPSATCNSDLNVEKTWKNLSPLPSEENPKLSSLQLGEDNNVLSSADGATTSNSLQVSEELNSEVAEPKSHLLSKKQECLYDGEDETTNCSLDSSDDDDELVPLEQILTSSAGRKTESTKQGNSENSPMDTTVPSYDAGISKTTEGVSFMNHLDRLLKEREELKRVDELEQQLQQLKQQVENSSLSEVLSNDGELSAEHREFLEKFSINSNAIPDQHPGEDIFQISQAGKIFTQHNLDLRNFEFHPQNPIEKYLLGSGIKQQLFVITEGLLKTAYHSSSCPEPILKWMFQMMSIHPDSSVSRKILDMLMTLTIRKSSADNDQQRPWIPSLLDITTNLINMGIPFRALFPLQEFQPTFSEDDIMSETHNLGRMQPSGNIFGDSVPFFVLIDTNLCNMAKFLRLCISIYPEGYTDREIFQLLLLLFKLSLEKMLKMFPLVELACLIIKLLDNIREWDTKMSELCLAISCLSEHHHDLLWLVQFVPNWGIRGRQVRRHLSLVVISKFLKKPVNIPKSHDQQMLLLCKDLVEMKPSNLLKKVLKTEYNSKESLLSDSEPEAYYLTYVLLHLVREASDAEITNSNQRKLLLKLCSALEKHVKCDIREDVRLFYKTKVKDLVARIYSKWQQMIHSSWLPQGQIHDFWVPDS